MSFSCGLLDQSKIKVTHGPASLGQGGIISSSCRVDGLGEGEWEQQGTGIKAVLVEHWMQKAASQQLPALSV